jgi:hypothetical protein
METEFSSTFSNEDIWIITGGGRPTDLHLNAMGEPDITGPEREYHISDFARYMLDPRPIEISEELIGCEVHHQQPLANKIRENIRRILPQSIRNMVKDKKIEPEKFTSTSRKSGFCFNHKNLEAHLQKIDDMLRPYDSTIKKVTKLDPEKVTDISGICEDIGGNRYQLNLKGNIEDKINYMATFLFKDVKVTLKKAYVSKGLFEMRGYDFKSFDPQKKYRLIKLFKDGEAKYCVVKDDGKVDFWIDDNKSVFYMHLLEQSIKTNSNLKDSFNLCIKDGATPLKLFFNKQLEIDYSKTELPGIYKKMFIICNIENDKKDIVMDSLNNMQRVVLFNYVPSANHGKERLFTNISVMHDFKALEPLKNYLPQLYLEMYKLAPASDAGKFYLLDSMRGYGNGK